jgi:DNA-binding transcriptional LysR family regulator
MLLRQLEYLNALAREGHFGRAGRLTRSEGHSFHLLSD